MSKYKLESTTPCPICGELPRWAYNTYCSQECAQEARRRGLIRCHPWSEDNPSRKSTKRMYPKYHRIRWKRLSRRIRKRDDNEFNLCFSTEYFNVHHIISNEESFWSFYEGDNLVTVCSSCHMLIHSGEIQLPSITSIDSKVFKDL